MTLAHPQPEARDSTPPFATRSRAEDQPKSFLRAEHGILVGFVSLSILGAVLPPHAVAEPITQIKAPHDALSSYTPPKPEPPHATLHEDDEDSAPSTLAEQRQRLLARMRTELELGSDAMNEVERIFEASSVLGQGNPALTVHPLSRSECRRIQMEAGIRTVRSLACGAPNMVPLYAKGEGESADQAKVCIDRFEFPNIPCEYPVVQVRAREAALLCKAVGKRLCDAHEWEGACAGSLGSLSAEYEFGRPRGEASWYHNFTRVAVWSYGSKKDHTRCATGSFKTPGCVGGYDHCGSNTYPAGSFPSCVSPLGVFDLHGNVAEHMNLPIVESDLMSRGGDGFTEMKGSWFIFGSANAHPDDCHYRAPDWHETRTMSEASHYNYHLGFRCCRDVAP